MERIRKKILCQLLNEEVKVTYFVDNVMGVDGSLKMKTVMFYNCGSKNKCDISYNMRDCSCFHEMKKVEAEVNEMGK